MHRPSSVRRSPLLVGALVLLATAMLGACGGSGSDGSADGPPTSETQGSETAVTTITTDQTTVGGSDDSNPPVERTGSVTIAGTDYELEVTECLLTSPDNGPGAEGSWPSANDSKLFVAISAGGIGDAFLRVQNTSDFDASDGVTGVGDPKEVFQGPFEELTYDSDGKVATYTGSDIVMESNQGGDPITVEKVEFSCPSMG